MRQQDPWQLAGSGPAQYERYQVPSLFQPLAERLLATVPLRTGERVLDVACGTGIVARLAAQPIGTTGLVTGVDLNPGMLEVARAHTPTSGAAVDWREGDAEALPCDDESYDVVLCQQGLQFFPDQPRALREMYRVLKSGGRVALNVWRGLEHNPFNQAVAAGLARHVSAEAAASIRVPLYTATRRSYGPSSRTPAFMGWRSRCRCCTAGCCPRTPPFQGIWPAPPWPRPWRR
jgi:SAM-dependent methyltransferase